MTFFSAFSLYFRLLPTSYSTFLLFNCQFSVASLTNISKKNFSHFQKGASMQVNYFFQIYIKQIFFSCQKRCRYAVPAHTVTKKPCKYLCDKCIGCGLYLYSVKIMSS